MSQQEAAKLKEELQEAAAAVKVPLDMVRNIPLHVLSASALSCSARSAECQDVHGL